MNAATGQSTEVPSATPSIRVATVASLDVCAVKLVDSDWVDAARAVLPTANETNRLAQWFRVLGDPTRTRLLCALLEADKLCLCDLAATIDTAETTVSHALRWLRTLAWATVSWNVVEAAVAIGAGVVARSIALVGFGLDSTVEVLSALVIIWQFRFPDADRERRALRLIATSFFALAAYITMQAAQDLARGDRPTHTPVGIALAVAQLIVMPLLSAAKKSNGRKLGSVTVIADANQTKLCSYLSAVLLAGLAVREGREAWQGESCDDCC